METTKSLSSKLLDGENIGNKRNSFIRRNISLSMVIYTLLIGLSIIFLLPLFWMISTSLKGNSQLFLFPPVWFPQPVKWSNYYEAINFIPFWTYLKNTCLITFFAVIGSVLSSSLVGFSFGCLRWPGRELFFILILSTMMLPGQVTMIPVFLIFSQLGWVDTFYPLTIPAFFGGGAFFIFLFRQFSRTIPWELIEAARMDGGSSLRIYRSIILPLSKPALLTVAIFSFIASWNDFLGPLIYLNSNTKKTVALGLQNFVMLYATEWNYLMCITLIMVLPVILLFFIAQRYFIQGITMTGIKG